MKVTQWDGVNNAKKHAVEAQIRLAEAELEQAENLLLDIEHKLAALYEEYDAIPEFNGFTTVEIPDAAQ
jgi:hypothetical protein